nr:immunoglobulin heavy chain junction region [Mus musculus]MBK4187358.1 immunoglobulin heavy chain junction region [Mus musculus]MBK4187359.1 immunoglobulin heavy chain junction region [Mus musculus]MBK4187360.1 immunoglobulin heavy chain junction region [Mus musculus]MBK4187361.1 immunoglobulin heavy chain junction region [Mus musculus]
CARPLAGTGGYFDYW